MTSKIIEVFGMPSDAILSRLGEQEPNIWNGEVHVKKYRVTIEEIEEPKEVLRERLQKLYDKPGHISNAKNIQEEAKRLGIELK